MIDVYENYFCDRCERKSVSNVGNPLHSIDDLFLCDYCVLNYVAEKDRKCGLCGEVQRDESVAIDKFVVKGFAEPLRVCTACINYDSSEQQHQLIRKI